MLARQGSLEASWDRFAVLDYPADGLPCVLLPESGWGALISWVVGPNWVFAVESREHRVMREVMVARDGSVMTKTFPLPAEERDRIDDDIDSYLEHAIVPSRPRRRNWFMWEPQGLPGRGFERAVNLALNEFASTSPLPNTVRHQLEQVVPTILAGRARNKQ